MQLDKVEDFNVFLDGSLCAWTPRATPGPSVHNSEVALDRQGRNRRDADPMRETIDEAAARLFLEQ